MKKKMKMMNIMTRMIFMYSATSKKFHFLIFQDEQGFEDLEELHEYFRRFGFAVKLIFLVIFNFLSQFDTNNSDFDESDLDDSDYPHIDPRQFMDDIFMGKEDEGDFENYISDYWAKNNPDQILRDKAFASVENGDLKRVKFAIEEQNVSTSGGKEIGESTKDSFGFVHIAAETGNIEMLEYLKGFHLLCDRNIYDQSVIHILASLGHYKAQTTYYLCKRLSRT